MGVVPGGTIGLSWERTERNRREFERFQKKGTRPGPAHGLGVVPAETIVLSREQTELKGMNY